MTIRTKLVFPPKKESAASLRFKTIVVLGSWGSGEATLSNYISLLGSYSCTPQFSAWGAKVPKAVERHELNQILSSVVDEEDQVLRAPIESVMENLAKWLAKEKDKALALDYTSMVVDHPLLGHFIEPLVAYVKPTFVVITRRMESIEETRLRLGWPASKGQPGALKLYGSLFSKLMKTGQSFFSISYEDLLTNAKARQGLQGYLRVTPPIGFTTAPQVFDSDGD
jgi:hypothetical protein